MSEDSETFVVVDVSDIPVFIDGKVGVAEVVWEPNCKVPEHNHSNYMQAIFLTFVTIEGLETSCLIPPDSALGQCILEGHLEILSKNALDSLT